MSCFPNPDPGGYIPGADPFCAAFVLFVFQVADEGESGGFCGGFCFGVPVLKKFVREILETSPFPVLTDPCGKPARGVRVS
jgi:hypothetical protein